MTSDTPMTTHPLSAMLRDAVTRADGTTRVRFHYGQLIEAADELDRLTAALAKMEKERDEALSAVNGEPVPELVENFYGYEGVRARVLIGTIDGLSEASLATRCNARASEIMQLVKRAEAAEAANARLVEALRGARSMLASIEVATRPMPPETKSSPDGAMPDDMTPEERARELYAKFAGACETWPPERCRSEYGTDFCACQTDIDVLASALKAAEARGLRRAAEVAKGGAKQCADGESEWHRRFRYAARATALEIAHEINSLAEDRG